MEQKQWFVVFFGFFLVATLILVFWLAYSALGRNESSNSAVPENTSSVPGNTSSPRTSDSSLSATQSNTRARDPRTGVTRDFRTPLEVPLGWQILPPGSSSSTPL